MPASTTSLDEPTELSDGLNIDQSEDQLVVALDFGTTFSGIAYAFANDLKPEIISIVDWPGEFCRGFDMRKITKLIQDWRVTSSRRFQQ